MKQIEQVIDILNKELQRSPKDTHRILSQRIPVSADFGRDSEFICYAEDEIPMESNSCTPLGMLNGILDALGIGRVAVMTEGVGKDFKVLGFCDFANCKPKPEHD